MTRLLTVIDKDPAQPQALAELRRVVHTLKGAAATVGYEQMAQVSHHFEDLLDQIAEAGANVTRPVIDLMYDSSDLLTDLLYEQPDTDTGQLLRRYAALATNVDRPTKSSEEPQDVIELPDTVHLPTPKKQAVTEQPVQLPLQPSEIVRVPLDRLDELVRLTSEFVITRTALEQHVAELASYVNEIAPSLERIQRLAARLDSDYYDLSLANETHSNGRSGAIAAEFDTLEIDRYTELYMLSRDLNETASDIKTVHGELRHLLGDFDSIVTRQSRLSNEVQEKLMRTRMLPLQQLVPRLQRAVRVVARRQNKRVELEISGEHIELDKKVLEEIADPLLHLLRNAVDHGVEPPELRQAIDKSPVGNVRIHAYQEGNQVIIEVSDDGAGLDIDKLRASAVAGGYISEADAAKMDDERLYQLIFIPGFSTASEVDDISGRGVGLDVVRDAINRLKGSISLHSDAGQGVTFTIRLPLTLAVIRGLLIKTRGHTYAIGLANVSQILRLDRASVMRLGENPLLRIGDTVSPLLDLGDLLHLPPVSSGQKRLPVILLKVNDRQVALAVDEIIEGRDIVIKPLGSHLRHVHGVAGATLLGSGRVVLILNEAELLAEDGDDSEQPLLNGSGVRAEVQPESSRDVLVVDDSVSVRKVVANMIKNAGWNPIPARDGVEALELIEGGTARPEAILLDIEMPRMNGFELTATLRANERYRNIPIIMLTSRAGEKHRRKALELGANDYLVKPYREEDLLQRLAQVTRLEATSQRS